MSRLNKHKFRVLHSKSPVAMPRSGSRMSGAERRLTKRRDLRDQERWVAGFVLPAPAIPAMPKLPERDLRVSSKAFAFCAIAGLIVLGLFEEDGARQSLYAAVAISIAALVAILFAEGDSE